MKRTRFGACVAVVCLAAACGGASQGAGGGASSAQGSSGGATAASGASADGGAQGEAATSSEVPHRSGGLLVHVTNLHASGSLPEPADPQRDHLDVTFTLELTQTGTMPLTGVSIARTRLVGDDGREVVFGVENNSWDGRLEPGQQRQIPFQKTPDSAHPIADHSFCGAPVRLEVTLDLAGRRAVAESRHVQIQCPPPGS